MTTLVVGAGYLGRRVAARLIARGDRVIATTRSEAHFAAIRAIGAEPIRLDILGPLGTDLLVYDRLIYCVGFDRKAGVPQRTVYVEGLARFLERFGRVTSRFVYTSSTGVYGQDDKSWVEEDSPTEPRGESGRACLEAEALAIAAGATIVRLAGLYGPGRIIRRSAILAGEPVIGEPDKVVNLVQIEDAAAATVAALDRGVSGRVYNVVDDRPIARDELYRLTAALLGVPGPRFVPAPASGGSSKDDVDRRVSNNRMKRELGVRLLFPDAITGLAASIADRGGAR